MNQSSQIKIVIIDNHYIIRKGIRHILEPDEHIEIVAEAADGKEGLKMIRQFQPNIVLLDEMPTDNGIETLKRIKEEFENIKVVMLTVEDDSRKVRECIHLGADGYVLKDSVGEDMIDVIYSIHRDDKYIDPSLVATLFSNIRDTTKEISILSKLTYRDIELLYFISKGYSNRQISEELFLSEKTVKNYASKLFKKIDTKDRVQATILAIENNIEDYYNAIRE